MNPIEKTKTERLTHKDKRKSSILATSEKLFAENGIERTTMQEIADATNIGIATLFRYFPKKDDLVIAVAVEKIKEVWQIFQKANDSSNISYEKLATLFDLLSEPLIMNNDQGMKFLEDFDSYAVYAKLSSDDMQEWNQIYLEVSKIFQEIVHESEVDASIRNDISVTEVLTTLINGFTVFSRKLSVIRLTNNFDISATEQIKIMKEIFLNYLKA